MDLDSAHSRLLESAQEGSVDWLHARGTNERSHEPVVDAFDVVGVHAGQESDTVAHHELDHTDDALARLLGGSAAVVGARGQMLNETNAFSYLNLFLLA